MTREELSQLASKVSEGKASMAELALYNAACEAFQKEEIRWPGMEKDLLNMEEASLKQIWAEQTDKGKVTPKIKLWPRIAAVAAAVALIVLGVYFFSAPRHSGEGRNPASAQYATDIAPGKNGATITLANGKVINLSDAKSGVVIGDDKLAYNDGSEIDNSSLSRSDISPRGGESSAVAKTAKGQTYIFTLPDGTKVWLNAASTLTIPSDFSGTESRKVELTGEAYFEVTKNKAKPFIVQSNGQEVTVLGTHFNVSAYQDEGSIKTTLLEGSVRVSGRDPSELGMTSGRGTALSSRANANDLNAVVLKPNQQSVVSGSNRITVKEVDIQSAIDWKNGKFAFSSEELGAVLRKVARWYDVDIVYKDDIAGMKVTGGISRYDQVTKLFDILEATGGIKFKIEGRKVIVSK